MKATLQDGREVEIAFRHVKCGPHLHIHDQRTECVLTVTPRTDPDGAKLMDLGFLMERALDRAGKRLILGTGEARCSREDQFVKEKGRRLSLTRALKQSGLDREDRRRVWAAYNKRPRQLRSRCECRPPDKFGNGQGCGRGCHERDHFQFEKILKTSNVPGFELALLSFVRSLLYERGLLKQNGAS